jgi:hypothetical protein
VQDAHWSHASSAWGNFTPAELTIRIQGDMPSIYKLADTLFHEISHAIWYVYRLSDEDKEERIVGTLATAWTQVLRDNPWILDWYKAVALA